MLGLHRRKKIANFEEKILIEKEKEILWPNCGGIWKEMR